VKYVLKLYVVADTAVSTRAERNLKNICAERLQDEYIIEVIDILKTPKLAVDESIRAIPTLIKELPAPLRRVIGDLSNVENVLLGLGLTSQKETTLKTGGLSEYS
jgi:circadian clock protein KaiB